MWRKTPKQSDHFPRRLALPATQVFFLNSAGFRSGWRVLWQNQRCVAGGKCFYVFRIIACAEALISAKEWRMRYLSYCTDWTFSNSSLLILGRYRLFVISTSVWYGSDDWCEESPSPRVFREFSHNYSQVIYVGNSSKKKEPLDHGGALHRQVLLHRSCGFSHPEILFSSNSLRLQTNLTIRGIGTTSECHNDLGTATIFCHQISQF